MLACLSEEFGLAEPVAGDEGNHDPTDAMSRECVQVFGYEAGIAVDEAALRVLDRDSEHSVGIRQRLDDRWMVGKCGVAMHGHHGVGCDGRCGAPVGCGQCFQPSSVCRDVIGCS